MAMKLGEAYVRIRADDSKFRTDLTTMHGKLKGVQVAMNKVAAAARKTFMVTGVAIAGATYAAVKFEKQMAMVSTMLSGPALQSMDNFRTGIRSLSVQFGDSTATLAKGMYDILSAGIDSSKAMDVLEVSTKAAVGGMTSTAVAADVLTTVLNSYSMDASDAVKVSDMLFATVKRGKLTYDELASSLGKAAATSAIAGLKLEELLAAVATITRAGIGADQAMTSVVGVLRSFLKPSEGGAKLAREMGFELNTATLKAEGFAGIMKRLNGLSAEQIATLFPNIRGLKGIAAAMQDAAGYTKDVATVTNSAGMAMEAFTKMNETAYMKLKRLKTAFMDVAVTLGESLLPMMESLTDILKVLIKAFADLPKWVKTLVAGLLGWTAVISGAVFVGAKLAAGLAWIGAKFAWVAVKAGLATKAIHAYSVAAVGAGVAGAGAATAGTSMVVAGGAASGVGTSIVAGGGAGGLATIAGTFSAGIIVAGAAVAAFALVVAASTPGWILQNRARKAAAKVEAESLKMAKALNSIKEKELVSAKKFAQARAYAVTPLEKMRAELGMLETRITSKIASKEALKPAVAATFKLDEETWRKQSEHIVLMHREIMAMGERAKTLKYLIDVEEKIKAFEDRRLEGLEKLAKARKSMGGAAKGFIEGGEAELRTGAHAKLWQIWSDTEKAQAALYKKYLDSYDAVWKLSGADGIGKLNKELDHWTNRIDTVNAALKKVIATEETAATAEKWKADEAKRRGKELTYAQKYYEPKQEAYGSIQQGIMGMLPEGVRRKVQSQDWLDKIQEQLGNAYGGAAKGAAEMVARYMARGPQADAGGKFIGMEQMWKTISAAGVTKPEVREAKKQTDYLKLIKESNANIEIELKNRQALATGWGP